MSNAEIQRELGDERRIDIMVFIRDFISTEGYSPSIRDIMKGCGFNSTSSVAHHLAILRDLGKIEYQPRIARSIRLV